MDKGREQDLKIWGTLFCLALIGAVVLWGLAGPKPPARDSAACQHWLNVRSDVAAGVLTPGELRSKLVEVRDSAPDARVRDAATKMLSGLTGASTSGSGAGMGDLDAACA